MNRILEQVETRVVMLVAALMALAIVGATADLAWTFVKALLSSPFDFLTVAELLVVFDAFLLVLIGLELLETVRTYAVDKHFHVEEVLMVALIAVGRKVIFLEFKEAPAPTVGALAAMVIALAGGYYLLRRAGPSPAPPGTPPAD